MNLPLDNIQTDAQAETAQQVPPAQTNDAPVEAIAQNEQSAPEQTGNKKQPTMQDIKKQYFPSTNLDAGNQAANTAMELVNAEAGAYQFNFNTEEALPANYGLAIAPKNERDKQTGTTNTVGVTIAAIPEYELLMQSEAGAQWIKETIQTALISKLQNAVRTRSDGSAAASIPFTVEDFITSNRPEGVLVAFRKLAGGYVKLLKQKGLTLMTPDVLRQILTSSAFAEAQFPKIPQATWEKIITSMIAKAADEDIAAGNLTEWLSTRDNAGLPEVKDVDLADLDFSSI